MLNFSVQKLYNDYYVPSTDEFKRLREALENVAVTGEVVAGRCDKVRKPIIPDPVIKAFDGMTGYVGMTGCVGPAGSSDPELTTPLPEEEICVRMKLFKVSSSTIESIKPVMSQLEELLTNFSNTQIGDYLYFTAPKIEYIKEHESRHIYYSYELNDKGRKIFDLMNEEDCDVNLADFLDNYENLFTKKKSDSPTEASKYGIVNRRREWYDEGYKTISISFPNKAIPDFSKLLIQLVKMCSILPTESTPSPDYVPSEHST